jgi:microcystin-dependent protein
MTSPFLAEIKIVSFNFAAKGWALSDGQLMPINQNQALFSLLGITYGGDGQRTFALPNLQGRIPMHAGQGAGLSSRTLGSYGGVESVTQQPTQIPGAPVSPVTAYIGPRTQVPTISPFLVLNFIIALQGIFPTRS